MSLRRRLTWVGEGALLLVVCALVAGQFLGYPVLVGFVETGSMAPTLDPGDGFVAIPAALAGPVGPGDVVTFRAEELNGGDLTTHRVIGRTDRGYLTKGDANPFPDQDGDEPPVKDAQIVAVALQIGGTVVVIPEVGTAVGAVRSALTTVQGTLAGILGPDSVPGTTGLGYAIAAAAGALYLVDVLFGSDKGGAQRSRSRDRDRGTDVRVILVGFALLLVVGATVAMVVPAGTQKYSLLSADFESDRPTVVEAGETAAVPYTVNNAGVVPMVVYVTPASEGVTVDRERIRVPPGGTVRTTVLFHAPAETGQYRRFVAEHRYFAVLPTPVIDALYRLHPWAPIGAVNALLGGGLYVVGRLLVGSGRVRGRRRRREGGEDGVFGRFLGR
jgi:signal peptidase